MKSTSKLIQDIQTKDIRIGTCTMIGKRNTMEDRIFIHHEGEVKLLAVFDGHGSDLCAEFMRINLTRKLLVNEIILDEDENIVRKELYRIFTETNEEFKEFALKRESGCTCCLAIIHGSRCTICNLGDSRLMVVRDSKIIFQTIDHTPANKSEMDRLISEKIFVVRNRIYGVISVSRSFGDFFYNGVLCEPEVSFVNLKQDDIIFLSSDGVCSNRFNFDTTLEMINLRNHNNMALLSAEIAHDSTEFSGGDNSSCIICKISGGDEINQKIFIPYSYPLNDSFIAEILMMCEYFNLSFDQALKSRLDLLKRREVNLTAIERLAFRPIVYDLDSDDDYEPPVHNMDLEMEMIQKKLQKTKP